MSSSLARSLRASASAKAVPPPSCFLDVFM
jgi:hypothetical protein